MPFLHFDALPRDTKRSTIIRLLEQVGGLERGKVGAVRVTGRQATAEVPERWLTRLAAALDGVNLADKHIRCWTDSLPSGSSASGEESFFDRQMRLLELEAKAEAEQALAQLARLSPEVAQRTGRCLYGLSLRDRNAGLGGRCLLTLGARRPGQPLPWTRLNVGSPVLLTCSKSEASLRGVVSRRSPEEIEAAFDRWPPEEFPGPFRLDISNDEISRQRQRRALQRAQSASGDRLSQLRKVLLGDAPPDFQPPLEFQPQRATLNESQREAVGFALAARDLAIIHGPPGTGKTTTVVELIVQAVAGGDRVLASAPSNLAVDNMLERLIEAGVNVIRIGHPARVLPQLRERTLDLIVQTHPDMQLVKKLTQQATSTFAKADRYTRARPAPGEKRQLREEARQLLADAKRIESQLVRSLLDRCDVLCSTTTGLDSDLLGQRRFDLAVIDEACQAVEPGCWIPVLRSERIVLAGDHCQLPPTVLSREAAQEGFHVSMLERLVERFGDSAVRRLDVQYRMHQTIMRFSSEQFYEGSLTAAPEVAEHRLDQLETVGANEWTAGPLQFLDTAGSGAEEEQEPDGESRLNPGEAEWVERVVGEWLNSGLAASDIAVISPYGAQVRLLRERLREAGDLEVDTVDGFQGREKEAVVVSLVRSNNEGEIGFLGDTRRMNVAWTRARRKLIVIGDSATIGGHPFYAAMLQYLEACGAYHSVWEYASE